MMLRHHNLVRPTDRIDAAVTTVAILLVAVMIPIAAALGTLAYADSSASSQAAQATGQWVDATYVAVDTSAGPSANPADPRATWVFDGRSVTDTVSAAQDAAVGQKFSLWIDKDGAPTSVPASGPQAAAGGVGTAVSIWLVVALLITGCRWFAHRGLARRSSIAWEQEWVLIDAVSGRPRN